MVGGRRGAVTAWSYSCPTPYGGTIENNGTIELHSSLFMLKRANQNKEKVEATNVSFVESSITDIPIPHATVDCIISNCVVNPVPESDSSSGHNFHPSYSWEDVSMTSSCWCAYEKKSGTP